MKIATAEQMRAVDRAAMERGVAGIVLMENAGRAVFGTVVELAAELGENPVVAVVAGKGNNGGDGLVAARYLRNQGYDVRVELLCAGEDLAGDAASSYRAAREYGVPITERAGGEDLRDALASADVVVDAVLGTGIAGEVQGPARDAIEAINEAGARVVAVDLASGLDADTGAVCGVAVRADVTVTFGLPKVGNVVYPGAGYCGEVRVADIGLPADALGDPGIATELITSSLARACLPPRWPDMHKGDAGRVLVVAGARGYSGAAALAAMGALRAGAGLVYLAVPASLQPLMDAKCTEAITFGMPETPAGSLSAAAMDEVAELAANCDVVALGPGLSRHPNTAALVQMAVRQIEKPLVIDADGLNCVADVGPERLGARVSATVITPHPGELSRLLGVPTHQVQEDRLGAARRAAASLGVVTVLKGAGTIVAAQNGSTWVNTSGSSALASGGTGDVLTGIAAAFVAGGAALEEAAIAAVYYHGLAGELAAARGSERAVIASDLLAALGEALSADETD